MTLLVFGILVVVALAARGAAGRDRPSGAGRAALRAMRTVNDARAIARGPGAYGRRLARRAAFKRPAQDVNVGAAPHDRPTWHPPGALAATAAARIAPNSRLIRHPGGATVGGPPTDSRDRTPPERTACTGSNRRRAELLQDPDLAPIARHWWEAGPPNRGPAPHPNHPGGNPMNYGDERDLLGAALRDARRRP